MCVLNKKKLKNTPIHIAQAGVSQRGAVEPRIQGPGYFKGSLK